MPDLPPPPPADAPWRAVPAALVARFGLARVLAAGGVALVVAVAAVVAVGARPSAHGPPLELSLPRAGAGSGDSGSAGPAGGAPGATGGGRRGAGAGAGSGDSGSVAAGSTLELVAQAAGAVAHPGVYRLPAGSRVSDLLQAAGGPAEGADLDRLNLAALVVDGSRVYVPRAGEPDPVPPAGRGGEAGGGPGGGVVAAPGPIDLNAATLEQLEGLDGIGPATAKAILDERAKRGRFRSVDELLDVRGIGPAKLAAIRDQVRV